MSAERPQFGGGTPPHEDAATITKEDYLRIYPKLVAQIRGFGVSNNEDLQDLIHQTFLEAQKELEKGKFEGRSAFDTWVISICKNVCLKEHRRQRAKKRKAREVPIDAGRPSAPELAVPSSEPLPDRQAEDREQLGRVMQSLRSLPDPLREPLVMKARGLSYQQIAQRLGIDTKLVTSRIHQARTELKRKLPRQRSVR